MEKRQTNYEIKTVGMLRQFLEHIDDETELFVLVEKERKQGKKRENEELRPVVSFNTAGFIVKINVEE